jgi:hypothetical protein
VTGSVRGVVLGTLVAAVLGSCIVRRFSEPKLTGTCDGACAHYVECKPGHSDVDGKRCRTECPDVFSDQDSLKEYEKMSCQDAVEYVDGVAPKSASQR